MSDQIVTYDISNGLAYIYLNGKTLAGGVHRTLQASADILLDFDKNGALIGIELLDGALLLPELKLRAIKPGEKPL